MDKRKFLEKALKVLNDAEERLIASGGATREQVEQERREIETIIAGLPGLVAASNDSESNQG